MFFYFIKEVTFSKKLENSETILFISQIIIALLILHENSIIYIYKIKKYFNWWQRIIKLIDLKNLYIDIWNKFVCSCIGNL